ncbi:DUF3540 domain-containing protein [Enterobacter asburiae]|uniref:DUF3540 domain-containing protein n=1 Tax=Scandinavium sp. UTDF21-P1B TaxID=3446379 RepID=UPI00347B8D97
MLLSGQAGADKTAEVTILPERARRLSPGTMVVADIKRNKQGELYLAAYSGSELKTAASCLLKPQEGDRVRAVVDQKTFFITDILQRDRSGPLEINCGNEALHISAAQLILDGGSQVEIKAEKIAFSSRMARWVAEHMTQVARRWFVQAEDASRIIKFDENVEARNINHQAEEMVSVKGKLTSISGSTVVKVDGSQIHMG